MSKSATVLTPPLDLEHDEPTQFMLQLMQTSIKRRMESRKGFSSNVFKLLISPPALMSFLIITSIGLTIALTLHHYISLINYLQYFRSVLYSLLKYVSGIMCTFIVLILILPVYSKGGFLDIKFNERLIFSGIVGSERWAYLIRYLEIEPHIKKVRLYLNYLFSSILILLFLSMGYERIIMNKGVIGLFHHIIIFFITSGLMVSLVVSLCRIYFSFKLLMHNIKWSELTQQFVIFLWFLISNLFVLICKLVMLPDILESSEHLIIIVNFNMFFVVLNAILLLIVFSSLIFINKNIKQLKLTIEKSVRQLYILLNKFYYMLISIGVLIFCIEIPRLVFPHKYSKLINNSDLDLAFLFLLISIGIAIISTYWVYSRNWANKASYRYLVGYLLSSLTIAIVYIVLNSYGIVASSNTIFELVTRYLSMYVSLPSLMVLFDYSLESVFSYGTSYRNNFSLITAYVNILQLYIFVSVFPSLFARFMENIALQMPARPKI